MEFRVRFHGVRGSYPVPGPTTLRYGGNTSCVEVTAGERTIILDAGTGIIPLGRQIVRNNEALSHITLTLLFSHTHHDHTQGFPFFQPAYTPRCRLFIFGPSTFLEDLETTISSAMISPFFPVQLKEMPALKTILTVDGFSVILIPQETGIPRLYDVNHDHFEKADGDIVIKCLSSKSHPNGVMVYRIELDEKSLVYATDMEGYIGGDTRLIRFSKGADVLIHDSQYDHDEYVGNGCISHQSWGHSTPDMAISVAREAGVGKLVLFHHDPEHDDDKIAAMELDAKKKFPNIIAASEGLEIDI